MGDQPGALQKEEWSRWCSPPQGNPWFDNVSKWWTLYKANRCVSQTLWMESIEMITALKF